jgi:hypothetical protein
MSQATTTPPYAVNVERAPPLDQAAGIRRSDFRFHLNGKERLALGLAILTTLAPLAMAAWGSYHVS